MGLRLVLIGPPSPSNVHPHMTRRAAWSCGGGGEAAEAALAPAEGGERFREICGAEPQALGEIELGIGALA